MCIVFTPAAAPSFHFLPLPTPSLHFPCSALLLYQHAPLPQFHNPGFYDEDDDVAMYQAAMMRRGGAPRRFDEYFRCYPVVMLPGPDREDANHGGKVFLPPSALDKLTRLHITYPMLFELINGAKEKVTHAGVLEFIAEEGKIYLPYWIMQTLELEPGDLLQIKSTDLPLGTFIKLQPQSPDFLEISDPKAVLERAFQNFSCLTTGDVFSFAYNDNVYRVAVLETKPANPKRAVCTLETDLSVDFAPPVGYQEPARQPRAGSGTSTPRSAASGAGAPLSGAGGLLHSHGTMAQAINYASIAPVPAGAQQGGAMPSVNFASQGHRVGAKKAGSKAPTPKPATPVGGASTNVPGPGSAPRRGGGPHPLRLPPGKLFFGYEIKPLKKSGEPAEKDDGMRFQGQGQTLRKKKGDK
ncbi:ubiquitin fusion degradation protein UFD1-domain-containing protein [Lineolata rhizophorae]|uniref:Ubiquitin fusion degradation protein 1 n=1 Tax=Lineolata rhizophorae TaxID=578093 RepID=A0A6A6NZU7_9PEZI|nr:ubiquitin fusion degradation protein UFD1-domain-containing protein [Lineolata rhizophorae]